MNRSITSPRAKAKLADMMVGEVSLVDAAANLRKFVIQKRNSTMKLDKADLSLKLPPDAKRAIMEGLSQGLDKLTALATIVGDADEDETAAVPDELVSALEQCADIVDGLADQYQSAGAGADGEGGKPPVQGEGQPATGPMSPPGEAPGNVGPSGKALMKFLGEYVPAAKMAYVAKLLETATPGGKPPEKLSAPFAEGHNLTGGTREVGMGTSDLPNGLDHGIIMAGGDGSALGAEFRKSVGVANLELAAQEKGGRKISSARYQKLQDLHGHLGKLLNELAYDKAADGLPPFKDEKEGADDGKDGKKPGKPGANPAVANGPFPQDKAAGGSYPRTVDNQLDYPRPQPAATTSASMGPEQKPGWEERSSPRTNENNLDYRKPGMEASTSAKMPPEMDSVVAKMQASIEASNAAIASLGQIVKKMSTAPGDSNAGNVEALTKSRNDGEVVWPENMSEHVRNKNKAKNGAAPRTTLRRIG